MLVATQSFIRISKMNQLTGKLIGVNKYQLTTGLLVFDCKLKYKLHNFIADN